MRILLDECVHAGVKAAFSGHSVRTVAETGWGQSTDSVLLAHAEQGFDVLVTIDRKLERQQTLKKFKLGFVIARMPSNKISAYLPIFAELLQAAEHVKPGEVIHVIHPQIRVRHR